MAGRIRRNSMENLQIYDLDNLIFNRQLPPPLPPPRQHRNRLPAAFAFERYQFLCDRNRHKTDPIYAATPMFATILQSTCTKHRRQLLGTRIPTDIIKSIPHTSPESTEPESARIHNDKEDESSDENDNQDSDSDNDNDDGGASGDQSSSSSDDHDEDYLDDDHDKKGIVEQIFNRNKR